MSDVRKEIIMPVTEDQAARLIEIEALRQITDNLKRLNDKGDKQDEHLMDIRERLIRIESNKLDRRVEELSADVEDLKADRERRNGATSALANLWKNLPSIAAAIVAIVAIVFMILKTSGRL